MRWKYQIKKGDKVISKKSTLKFNEVLLVLKVIDDLSKANNHTVFDEVMVDFQ